MKKIDSYKLPTTKLNIKVEIIDDEKSFVPIYLATIPQVGKGTRLTLNEIKIEILSQSKLAVEKMVDLKFAEQVRTNFAKIADELLTKKMPRLSDEDKEILKEVLLNEMLGIGEFEYVLFDDNVEEIVINSSSEPAWVYHKAHGWLRTNIQLDSEKEIENLAAIIARRSGKQVNTLTPLLDAHLPSGDRANATLSPISSAGNTITIRRFRRKPWTVTELIKFGSISSEAMALVWTAFEFELNVLISGGTASGKTSFLNACSAFIRPNQRVLTIEDTRELTMPSFLHWVPLTTRAKNTESKGEITMLDLLVNSLRMRPDRIIVGEVRRQKEAEVMFEAMNTGHSVYTTFHADTADETIRRFSNPPISLPQTMLNSIGLNIVLFRNRRTGKRAVYQIAEIVIEDRSKAQEARANVLYRYNSVSDKLFPQKESVKFFDEIAMHTGLTHDQIQKDIDQKESILDWLIKKEIFDLDDLGKVFARYYLAKETVVNHMKKDEDPLILVRGFK